MPTQYIASNTTQEEPPVTIVMLCLKSHALQELSSSTQTTLKMSIVAFNQFSAQVDKLMPSRKTKHKTVCHVDVSDTS